MMMDTTVDTDGTAFICPECNFSGKSLPELMSHLNDAHGEVTASKSEAPARTMPSSAQPEKRSRRKPAFSHQIVSQTSRQSPTFHKQQNPFQTESDSNDVWNRLATNSSNGSSQQALFLATNTDDSSISIVSDENTNINMNPKSLASTLTAAKRNPNVLHSILSQQRPIAPKNTSPLATKATPASSPTLLPFASSPVADSSMYSPSNQSMQPYRKNFQCRLCHLTYKNFHDCTAHIRKKHEISHAQAGRFVEKLDTDAPLPPSATGDYKIRVKVKSLPSVHHLNGSLAAARRTSLTPTMTDDSSRIFQCKYCSYTGHWAKDVARHQRTSHPTCPPHVLQRDYVSEDGESHEEDEDDDDVDDDDDKEGPSALMIDPVRVFGEVIDPMENNNGDDYDDMDSQDEEIVPTNDEDEDDEDDALWKYQQEINDLSDSDMHSTKQDMSHHSFAQRFKKFQCPHCEHSAPTLTKLKLHVATHINIKPFMCSVCGWRANLRWYIQCHAKKRHPNASFEILQLSHEEAEQTINAYMKDRGIDSKMSNGQDSKRRFQCSLCQFRSNHPKFIEQHIATNHANKPYAKVVMHSKQSASKVSALFADTNGHGLKARLKFPIKSHPLKTHADNHDEQNRSDIKAQALYNRSSLIQSDGSVILPDPSTIVYPNFSTHTNFNPNRLFYCALCYRGYRWRYDVKRHHKTMHETAEDEAARGLSMSPKSVKRRNKEFNRHFRYLEYVPQLDGLIPASMSSMNAHSMSMKHEHGVDVERSVDCRTDDDDESQEHDGAFKLSIADARTVDVTEDEAAALLMIEPQRSDTSSLLIHDYPDEGIIVFEDDRANLSKELSPHLSLETSKTNGRTSSGFKPYRCPYCFYRTNWRTDSLRHIRARHKIEPSQDGYYEIPADEAESTYGEYERTFGFVVSKKVLGRFTEFRHIEWKELQRSIWEKIKDKQGYEQIIVDRLRPENDSAASAHVPMKMHSSPLISAPSSRSCTSIKTKRAFTCVDCAFRSNKLLELDRHVCSSLQKSQHEKPHGKCLVSLYQCSQCAYRTLDRAYARQHISLHRAKNSIFYYCSFCGYNHCQRKRITVHIAQHHARSNTLSTTILCRHRADADFSIRHVHVRRAFIEHQLNSQNSVASNLIYCVDCPHVSTSVLEHDHHRSCHRPNSANPYRCLHCSFASNSLLYTHQHSLLHSKFSRLLSTNIDTKNLKHLSVSTIFKETLGKHRRYQCPFCQTFSSSHSSIVLDHIQTTHAGNSSELDDSLIIGSDTAKEILALGETVTEDQRMDMS